VFAQTKASNNLMKGIRATGGGFDAKISTSNFNSSLVRPESSKDLQHQSRPQSSYQTT